MICDSLLVFLIVLSIILCVKGLFIGDKVIYWKIENKWRIDENVSKNFVCIRGIIFRRDWGEYE